MEHLFSLTFIKKLQTQLKHREIKALPEQIAFNLVMAIVPFLVIIVQLGAYLSLNTDFVKYLITSYAPEELQQLLLYLFNTSAPPQANTIFIIVTALSFFWLISKGFYGISNAANTTYQIPLMKFAYLERIFSFLMLCLMILLLVVTLVLVFLGEGLLNFVLHLFDVKLGSSLIFMLKSLQCIISFFSYLGFFLLLFYLAPTIKLKIHEIFPGALITATSWSIASVGFSFYVNYIANYNKFYGSLSVIIILLFWLYILGYTITLGLQVNYILKRDYYGELHYVPRLTFIKRFKFLSKWTNFMVNDEQNLK